jgi:hypothetical protein
MGEWRYSSTSLDLGPRWSWMVSFTPLPLYPKETDAGTRCVDSRMDPRAGLDLVRRDKFATTRNRNLAVQIPSRILHKSIIISYSFTILSTGIYQSIYPTQ